MIGVTIGYGQYYQMIARWAMDEVEKYTGLKTFCISSYNNPIDLNDKYKIPLVKFDIFDIVKDDDIFFFDADTIIVRDWDVQSLAGPSLKAVADIETNAINRDIFLNAPGMDATKYINTGMMILNRQSHKHIFEYAKKIYETRPFHYTCCYEQTYLNLAIHELGVELDLLDSKYNYVGFAFLPGRIEGPDDMVLAHAACGMDYKYKANFHGRLNAYKKKHGI